MGDGWLESDTEWVVTLWTGEILSIYADGYGVDGDDLQFDVLVPGKPPVLAEIARVPHALIEGLSSEFADRSGVPRVPPVERPQVVVLVDGLPPVEDSILKSDTEWLVTLWTGGVLSIYADDASPDGSDTVFTVCVPDDPQYRVEIARVPSTLIKSQSSEPADRPDAPTRYEEPLRMPFGPGMPAPTRPNAQAPAGD